MLMDQIAEIFSYSFMTRAFLTGFFVSMIAPVIGSFLVVRRIAIISDVFSHITLAGIAFGLFFKVNPFISGIVSAVLSSFFVEFVRHKKTVSVESILAMIMPVGLAVALILISFSDGVNTNLNSYFFGSITAVSDSEFYSVIFISIIVLAMFLFFYRQFLYASFDEESARLSNINVKMINYIFMILTALTISLTMKIVGVFLVGALSVIPVLSANQIVAGFKKSIFVSIIISFLSTFLGIFLSYFLSIPAGPAIILILFLIFLVNFFILRKFLKI